MAIKFTVNGAEKTIDADSEMPLLWALRDELRLTGTKFGCGVALCGACTVHVNGEAVRSCQTPLGDVAGANVTTIEGLESTQGKAVQQAWRELDVAQCGYCQSGQIMQASKLLTDKPKPTDADINEAMDGNVCRCATYVRIRAGIHRASEILEG